MGPIIGTVLLAGITPVGDPEYINGTYLVAGVDADGVPHILTVDANGNLTADLSDAAPSAIGSTSAGSGSTTSRTDHVHKVGAARTVRTAGNLAISTGAVLVEVSSALRVSVSAVVGDILLIIIEAYITQGNRNIIAAPVTIVSGAIVTTIGGTLGSAGLYVVNLTSNPSADKGVPITHTVVSGDISGGLVTVSLAACNETTGGTAGSVRADTGLPAVLSVVNFGH